MTWLRNWFGARARAKPAARPRVVPQLEALEKREVLTVTYHGGALLPHVEVQALYYGSNWSTNSALSQQAGQFEGYLQYLVNSPYMDLLTKAGYNVGRGSYAAGQIQLANLNSANYLDDSTIRSNIQADVSSGALQAADANRLFVVFVEPNIAVRMSDGSTSRANFAGYHGAFTLSDGSTAHYAVITTPGGTVGNAYANGDTFLSAFDEMTMAASHEIAEAVTDPNVNYSTLGWYDAQKNGEIGDIVNGQVVYLNGYAVQKEPDKNDNPIFPTELSVTGETFSATAGQTFSGNVAVGNDSVGLTHGYNLAATINWGDGAVTQGAVTDDGHGDFFISGAHTYGQGGNFAVSVSLHDVTNSIASASETTTENVQGAAGGGGGGGYVVADFAGQGVWRHSSSGWQQLTAADATRVSVDSHGNVVGEFAGYGVLRYEDATGWRQLTPANATLLAGDANGDVAAEFAGYGVWRYEDAGGWRQLTPVNATQVAIAGNGIVAVELSGYGVWRYEDAGGWRQLTPANAAQVAVDANGDVAVEFSGYGVWRYEDAGGWRQLTAADATQVSIAGNGIVAVDFAGYGVYRFEDNGGWQHLNTADAAQIAVDAQGDVAGEYQGQGVWVFEQNGGWQHLTATDALFMGLAS